MINLTSSFLHYAQRAADKAGVGQDDFIARACFERMFKLMHETVDTGKKSPLEKYLEAEQKTLEWIQPRYESYKRYAPDFLKDHPSADHDAIVVVMLCSGHIDGENPSGKNAINPDIIKRANDLLEEAEKITSRVMGDTDEFDNHEPKPESMYLAHTFLGDMLYNAECEGYEGCDKEELQNLKDGFLSPIRAFVHNYTAIGRDITLHADDIEKRLDAMAGLEEYQYVTNEQPAPQKRPSLVLIQPMQPTVS